MYCKVEKAEFITVLQFLTKLTPFESDLDILDVHSKIVIHPLPFTNNFVLEFKQMTRNQLEYIKEGKESSAETTKIEIDDSLKTLIVDLTLEEDEEMQELK